MSLAGMLNATVTLQRQSVTKDASGGMVKTWAAVSGATSIAADIQPAGSSVSMHYAQRHLECSHQVYFASDVGARETDRIVEDSTSRKFLVQGYRPAAPGYSEWPSVADVKEDLN